MRYKANKWILLCVLIFSLGLVASAQSAETTALNAAIEAAQRALNITTRPSNWSYTIPGTSSVSTLGCPLATGGTQLAQPVTVYVFQLTFSSGQYTVYASADGQIRQLCDSKFTTSATPVVTSAPSATPNPNATPITPVAGATVTGPTGVSCTATVNFNTAAYAVPVTNLTPMVNYTQNAQANLIGRSTPDSAGMTWYQAVLPLATRSIGWLPANVLTVPTNCANLPVTVTLDNSGTASQCFITPASTFSNVRSVPDSTNANTVVGQIFENTLWQVYGLSPDSQWFLIANGWVATSVTRQLGNCTALRTINPNEVAVQPILAATAQGTAAFVPNPNISAATYPCPANFTGYLTPRIQTGSASAKVSAGGIPNRIRQAPTTTAQQIGTIQPNRTIDRVISGPACNSGFVWWEVEVDGIRGWTVESSNADQDYFLEPMPGFEVAAPVTAPSLTELGRISVAGTGSGQFVFSPDGRFVVINDVMGRLAFVDVATRTLSTQSIVIDTFIRDFGYAANNIIYLNDMNNKLSLRDVSNFAELRSVSNVNANGNFLDFHPNGTLFLAAGCSQQGPAGCALGQYELWDVNSGQALRIQPAHQSTVFYTGFNPDGTKIITIGTDGLQMWDLQSGSFLGAIATEPAFAFSGIAFSPDGTRLYTSGCQSPQVSADGAANCVAGGVTAWRADNLSEIAKQGAHVGYGRSLAISPDGRYLATVGDDKTIVVYDANTLAVLYRVSSTNFVDTVLFSPDGRVLVSKETNTTARSLIFWQLPTN